MSKFYQDYYSLKNPDKYLGKSRPYFRSSWEKNVMKLFDEHPSVTGWASESIRIPYRNPFTNKLTTYVPDFFVIYIDADGIQHAEIIEVKPSNQILGNSKRKNDKAAAIINAEKWKMAEMWCDQQGLKFRVITENEIFRSPKKDLKMKKLEEILNLPEYNEEDDTDFQIEIKEDEDDIYDMQDLEMVLSEVDKIDQALGTVRGLEVLDSEMDELAKKSMETFDKLIKMGEQVDDRNVAPIYDAASKLMSNAITAKQSKMDRKLKAIQLQIQKAKVDVENRKLDQKIKERRDRGDDAIPIEGTGQTIEINRTELLRQIIEKTINNSKED